MPGTSGTGTDTSAAGRSGNSNGGAQGQAGGGIAYGTGDDPFGDLGSAGSGGMTTAERRAELDRRLEEGYAVFDGMIITEREQAQSQADNAGSGVMGTGDGSGGEGGQGDTGFGEPGEGTIVVASANESSSGTGYMPGGVAAREGEFNNQNRPTYPIPEDIPEGNDDDVVARQLREAAMSEPDPALREKLWDEYRNYTGLSR